MRIKKPWPSGSVVSPPGQLGPTGNAVTGWYSWGWDGTPGVLPIGNALFFLADGSASPDYTESTMLARGAIRVQGSEVDRILQTLGSRGLLIGRPGTQYAGWRVVGDELTDEHDRSPIPASELVGGGTVNPITGAASGTGQTWQWSGSNWQANNNGPWSGQNGGEKMNFKAMVAFLRAQNYSRYLLAVTGSASGVVQDDSAADVLRTAIPAGDSATNAELAGTNAFRDAQNTINTAYTAWVQAEKTITFLEAFSSGDPMMAMFMLLASGSGVGLI